MPKKSIDERARFPVAHFGKSMAGQHIEAVLSLDAIDWLSDRDRDMSDVQLTTGDLNEHSRVAEYINDTKMPTWLANSHDSIDKP